MSLDEAAVAAMTRLPKVELHCHVEGTMRPATVAELAARNGHALPTDDPTELYHYVSLDDFLTVFWLVQSTLGSRDDWARLAYESVLDAAACGVVYRETFFTPARHLEAGQDLADIVAGLAEGLAAGEAETGTRVMLICDMDRAYGGAAGARAGRAADRAAPGRRGRHRAGDRRRDGLHRARRRPGSTSPTRTGWRPRPGCAGPRTRARTTRRRRSRPASTCSAPSGSTTVCPFWTTRS